jgi:hypothetical protein
MFEAAAEPKEFWVVEGAVHQDLLRFDPKGYEAHVLQFLARYLTPMAPAEDRAHLPAMQGKNIEPRMHDE